MLRSMSFRTVRNFNTQPMAATESRALTVDEARLYTYRQRQQCAKDAMELGLVAPLSYIESSSSSLDGGTGTSTERSTPVDGRSTPTSNVSSNDEDPQRWSRAPGGACAGNAYNNQQPRAQPSGGRPFSSWMPL